MIDRETLTGIVLNTESSLTLGELSRCCGVHAEFIVEMVGEGILDPLELDSSSWRFSGVSLLRVNRALRLRRDLGVNLAGIGLALDLIEEIEQLRSRLNLLEP